MLSARPRFGCFLFACLPTFPPFYPYQSRASRPPALSRPRSAPRVSPSSSLEGLQRLPGSRDATDQLLVSFPLP